MEGSMDHFVRLERLPDGVAFPADLADRIHYDADRHRLVFRGFMAKAEFDRLICLHGDWSFRRALEELFRLCVPDEPKRTGPLRWLRGIMAGSSVVLLLAWW
jgi:hypothetical protein